jgi:type II secretory pathway component PulF
MKLRYEGFDASGRAVQGTVEASDAREAGEKLRRQGVFVTSVDVERVGSAGASGGSGRGEGAGRAGRGRAPKRLQHISMITRQLAMLLTAGSQIVQALAALERQTKDPSWRDAITAVRTRVEEGASLSQAMEARPDHFDVVTRSLIEAGESGGQLPMMLQRLATLTRQQLHVRHAVLGALTYPTVLLVIAINVLILMLAFVLPRFTDLFESLDAPLPASTAMLMSVSEVMRAQWYFLVGGVAAIGTGAALFFKSERGCVALDTLMIRTPRFGQITRNVLSARLVRLLGVLVESKIPLLEALQLCSTAAGNVHFQAMLRRAEDSVTQGEPMSDAFTQAGLLPENVCEAVRNGESSGQLGPVMLSMADFLDEDNEVTLRSLASIIEPLILVVLGCVVGFVALSMFLPLFDLTAMTSPGGAQ